MATTKPAKKKVIRRSIPLSCDLDSKVHESGMEAKEAEKRHFFELVERLHLATDGTELRSTKEELAHMTFGA